jgi:hypothetical protein
MTAFARTKLTAIAGIAAVLVAACSSSPAQHALPLSATGSGAQPAAHTAGAAELLDGGMTQSRLLELQAAGRLEAPVPPQTLRAQLAQPRIERPHFALHPNARVALWVTNTNFNYILGQDASGSHTETAIDASQNSCYSPIALKVDRAKNLWVGCELTSPSTVSGAVQEYGPTGSFEKQYLPQCPKNVSSCSSFSGYGFDSGLDAKNDVFASINLYSMYACNPSCGTTLGAGFEWWPSGAGPSAKPKLISVGANCSPICGVAFMDVDATGNLWFTFSGYNATQTYGFGLGEIKTPTTKPTLKIIEPIGTYQFFGGVYVSGNGATLNVIDQLARTVSQYKLPLARGGKPFNVLGPTQTTVFGVGDPTSGAFNQLDTKMAIGDSGAWVDVGTTANAWTTESNLNFYSGLEGAAFTPSDK